MKNKTTKIIIGVIVAAMIIVGNYFGTRYLAGQQAYNRVVAQYEAVEGYNAVNLTRYIAYSEKNPDVSIDEVILLVNNDIDNSGLEYNSSIKEFIQADGYDSTRLKRYLEYYTNNTIASSDSASDKPTIFDVIRIVNKDVDQQTEKFSKALLSLMDDQWFIVARTQRYLDMLNSNEEATVREVVEAVNCNTDIAQYSDGFFSDPNDGILIIVNKYYKLAEDYVPANLVSMDKEYATAETLLVSEAYEAFKEMAAAAAEVGLSMTANPGNGYRSYDQQKTIYDYYVRLIGEEKAAQRAAKPCYSEHQTGLCIDIRLRNVSYADYSAKDQYKWAKDNSYLYGFIFRYSEENEDVTGYSYEPWHYRYVGKDAAKYIHDNGITFDEYYAYFVEPNK